MKKTAIITGAAQGIGKSIALTLLNNNYNVFLIDKQPITYLDSRPSTIYCMRCDVGREADVSTAINECLFLFERIDLIVNNAAEIIFKPIEALSYDEWNRVMQTNVGSIFLFAKYGRAALAKTRGSIINIASTRAYMSEANTESYTASKGAVIALTHSLALSMGPDIRVNSISPGWIDSRNDGEKKKHPLSEEDHNQHPAGRVGTPEDVASMVLWLADVRNDFITGQDFVLDGGMTKKMIYR